MFRLFALIGIPFFGLMTLGRIVLYIYSLSLAQINFSVIEFGQILGVGVINDIVVSLYIYTPLTLIVISLPKKLSAVRYWWCFLSFMLFVYVYILWFILVSEFFFWEE